MNYKIEFSRISVLICLIFYCSIDHLENMFTT